MSPLIPGAKRPLETLLFGTLTVEVSTFLHAMQTCGVSLYAWFETEKPPKSTSARNILPMIDELSVESVP